MIAIEYRNITKQYKNNPKYSVEDVNAKIYEGEFITILGSSGSGKTSLLKMTNRLVEPSKGQVILFGEDISSVNPAVVRRRMGYVIQQVGLFPHMRVEENISMIPNLLQWEKSKTNARVDELLTLVGLDPKEYRRRYPSQLSGGQQQRVGLARALAVDPKILLLDEPFGAIDAITRLNLQNELKRIHSESKKTFLLVTHDINEAFRLGERVMIMHEGKLVQFDTPQQIIQHPADAFVETLISSVKEQEKFWLSIQES